MKALLDSWRGPECIILAFTVMVTKSSLVAPFNWQYPSMLRALHRRLGEELFPGYAPMESRVRITVVKIITWTVQNFPARPRHCIAWSPSPHIIWPEPMCLVMLKVCCCRSLGRACLQGTTEAPCSAYVSESMRCSFPAGTTVLFLIVYFNRLG